MKKLLRNILIVIFIATHMLSAQDDCLERIEKENYNYVGCLDYEGLPHGSGTITLFMETQEQILKGKFDHGEFKIGIQTINFNSGNKQIIEYEDYQLEKRIKEEYFWTNGYKEFTDFVNGIKNKIHYVSSDGDETLTFFENGSKIREITTFGERTKKGLVIEKNFYPDGSFREISNIENYRNPEDVLGDQNFVDIPLDERNNQYRLRVGFKTLDGEILEVPIQFDSGASSGLFIGYRLYQELQSKCEIVDLDVSSKAGGVGSEFNTRYVKFKEIQIGEYRVKNVVAVIPERNDINDLLIGVGFLRKFSEVEWRFNSNTLRFYK